MFSIASDAGVQRNFKKGQQYWAAGHTTQAIFHLNPKEGIYTWFAYYSSGKFNNSLVAESKSPLTSPRQISYVNRSRMILKQFSVGYRKYLKGNADLEKGYNVYGYAGFGLIFGNVKNTHSVSIDTSLYELPVREGEAGFKRLTVDIGAGVEIPLGGDYFFYTEARLWIPTTSYPSKYIFVNNNAPYVGMIDFGIRVLF